MGASRNVRDWRDFLRPVREADIRIAELGEQLSRDLEREDSASRWDYASVLRVHVIPAFGELGAREITVAHVQAWRRALLASDYASSTVERCLTVLGRLLELARAQGVVEQIVTRLVDRQEGRAGRVADPQRRAGEVLTWPDVTRLCLHPSIPLERRAMYALLFLTGARPAEACGLRISQLARPEAGRLAELAVAAQHHEKSGQVRRTKTNVVRRVPVAPELLQLVDALHRSQSACLGRPAHPEWPLAGRIYPSPKDAPGLGIAPDILSWPVKRLRHWWQRDLARLGIPARGLYSTRHTFVSRALELGVNLEVARSFTHVSKKRDAFFSYLHLSWDLRCEAARLIAFDAPTIEALAQEAGQLSLFESGLYPEPDGGAE